MKRLAKIVLEADSQIEFKVSESTEGIEIRAVMRASEEETKRNMLVQHGDEKYMNPPVPAGYQYVKGTWNYGYIIKRISDGSQFIWVPVLALDADGTLDGVNFNEKFGRRNFRNDKFSEEGFHEEITPELEKQISSVIKYGGFYFSRYNMVQSQAVNGKIKSIRGGVPITAVNYEEAKKLAASFENRNGLTSHLPYGAEFDSVLAWIIQSGSRTKEEIVEDSRSWGNYWTEHSEKAAAKAMLETGSDGSWFSNNIADLAGNTFEWTQERRGKKYHVIRSGSYEERGNETPASSRQYNLSVSKDDEASFRVVLCIL